jgi:Na+-transporting methylmalonyl-CoA/oxaloacetate decarboxylase gamma subunit
MNFERFDQLLRNFIQDSSVIGKAVFLMVAGVLFVFAVQVVFYLIAKLWPRSKNAGK